MDSVLAGRAGWFPGGTGGYIHTDYLPLGWSSVCLEAVGRVISHDNIHEINT